MTLDRFPSRSLRSEKLYNDAFSHPFNLGVNGTKFDLDSALWGKFRSFWDINNSLFHKQGSELSERSGGRKRSEQPGASERMSGASERTSEWPSTYVPILGCSAPLCSGREPRADLSLME